MLGKGKPGQPAKAVNRSVAEVLTDERMAAVLRPFVRATAPVLQALRESDPLRLRRRFDGEPAEPDSAALPEEIPRDALSGSRGAGAQEDADTSSEVPGAAESADEEREVPASDPEGVHAAPSDEDADRPERDTPGAWERVLRQIDAMQLPGSSAWHAMSVEQRCDWWARRVGRFLALLAGLPRFGGAITSRLPIRNMLGVAGQALVLCAIAAEHGITDRATQVRLIAKVLLDRDLDDEVASGEGGSRAEEDAAAAELTEEIEESRRRYGRATPKALARTVWRMARALWEIHAELDKRPQGRFYHEWIGSVPVVGVVGGYLGERSALRTVARRGAKWIKRQGRAVG
jgi:hypothetical protein